MICVYKIGLNKSIRSQDIKILISNINQDPLPCSKFAKNDNLLQFTTPNVDLVNDNVHTKFGLFLSTHVNNMFLNEVRQ